MTSFRLDLPEPRTTSVIFASPHSGAEYPWSFLRQSVLDEKTIRSSEDAFVDRLFEAAPTFGAPLLTARRPRAYVDLNRGSDELDPAVISGVMRATHNPRIASGLGVIPRVVANGKEIYRGKMPMAEAVARISEVWHPYHEALRNELELNKRLFGEAILIDCHSMPHEAIDSLSTRAGRKPQIVLGDRFGAACKPEIVEQIEAAFARTGLRVARNAPFAGAYITQHYGRPSRNQHVVQVEIDRAIYMDEAKIRPRDDFEDVCRMITGVMKEITEIGRAHSVPLAAE